ncbi:hypothetical protein E2C01_063414 [Portunus trituberculatus]|uniref:Uncharacterized protein n=1 Tax=Portunus trituberculatus TaxID=210409 RepID=A0A5B7HKD9_PORTR|nr:hypothetical protein [Portunus trituberculatus]
MFDRKDGWPTRLDSDAANLCGTPAKFRQCHQGEAPWASFIQQEGSRDSSLSPYPGPRHVQETLGSKSGEQPLLSLCPRSQVSCRRRVMEGIHPKPSSLLLRLASLQYSL